ncbi:unnamed protein product [Scytosiphon promiscuus]
MHNTRALRGPQGVSIYKGVCVTRNNKWRAVIYIGGKQKYLGTYKSEIDAAKSYDSAAKCIFSDPKYLNFPYEYLI